MTGRLAGVLAVFFIGMWLAPAAASAQPAAGATLESAPRAGAEVLARGRYMIVTGHCNNCHTADYQRRAGQVPEQAWLTGRDVGHRGPWGTTYPANLRINANKLTEAEWVARAQTLKTRPGMPWWSLRDTNVDDLRAMYQFIRSLGPPGVPAREFLPPGEEPKTLYIQAVGAAVPPKPAESPALPVRVAAPPEAGVGANVPAVGPRAELIARGRYMLVTGHCNNCHTHDYGRLEGKVAEKEWLKGSASGHRGTWGTTYASNLRINVNQMTEAAWVTYASAVRTRPPMPWWALHETSVEDLRAMYQFIKVLGPPGEPAPPFLAPDQEPKPPYTQWPAVFPE